MVKKNINSKNKSVKEIIVEKPKEPSIISESPSKESKEPKEDITQIIKDSIKENATLLNAIGKDDTPKTTRKKREKKSPIKLGLQTKKSQPLLNEAEKIATGKSTGFYIGITIGIVLGTVGIYYLYQKLKSKKAKTDEELYTELKDEGVTKLEDIRKYA